MRNASGQKGENEQQWTRTQATKFFVSTCDISSLIKRATIKFQVLQINSKEMYKNQDCALHVQSRFFFFLLIRLTEFFFGRSHCRGRLALHNIFFSFSFALGPGFLILSRHSIPYLELPYLESMEKWLVYHIRALELHYPMIQFFMKTVSSFSLGEP